MLGDDPDFLPGTVFEKKYRLGSRIGVFLDPVKLYVRPVARCHPEHIGTHGGLRPAEMRVPLVVA